MHIDCFIPYHGAAQAQATLALLRASQAVRQVWLLTPQDAPAPQADDGPYLPAGTLHSTDALKAIARHASARYVLLCLRPAGLHPGRFALERLVRVADDTGAALVYSDRYVLHEGRHVPAPVIDYQRGSLRDDFDFGPLVLVRTGALQQAVAGMDTAYTHAGWYDLRLRLSEQAPIVHINEYLYTEEEGGREAGQFDYVDPRNRAVQLEMEDACTAHLRRIGAWLPPRDRHIDLHEGGFAHEASVIIPVRNRVRTIADALQSALGQHTTFPYNVIVVDNHSTDGTTEAIRRHADDPRLVHIIPRETTLGIGGCWNEAVCHPACGRFAVQLDSDDVYAAPVTLQRIVDAFHDQQCAMLVGSYSLTDLDLRPLPPGVIDHREWTEANGHNNLLRVNGMGAPRAFYTPLLRRITVPDTSYGEDYALALAFSRRYRIGRLYDVLYLCRRWEGNSDAALDTAKANAHNLYKDRLRTWEVEARIRENGAEAHGGHTSRTEY